MTEPGPIEVMIDRLVLDGYAEGDRHLIAAALQAELARLFTQQGVPASLLATGALPRLEAVAPGLQAGAPGSAVGTGVARSVFQSLGSQAGGERR